jgi:hypothetical protein
LRASNLKITSIPGIGIDILPRCKAPIPYLQYDGHHLSFKEASFDIVLIAYVLDYAEVAADIFVIGVLQEYPHSLKKR